MKWTRIIIITSNEHTADHISRILTEKTGIKAEVFSSPAALPSDFASGELLFIGHEIFSSLSPEVFRSAFFSRAPSKIYIIPENLINELSTRFHLAAPEIIPQNCTAHELSMAMAFLDILCPGTPAGDYFYSLVNQLPDVVYTINSAGNFTFISDKIKEYGYEPADLIGRHYSILIHPEDIPAVSRDMVLPKLRGRVTGDHNAPKLFDERRACPRSTSNMELRLVPAKEKEKQIYHSNVLVNASGVYNQNDRSKFLGTVGVISEIKKKSGDGLRKDTVKIPEIIFRTDDDGNFTYLSREVRNLGFAPEDFIGRHYSELFAQIGEPPPPAHDPDFTDFSAEQAKNAKPSDTPALHEWSEVNARGMYVETADRSRKFVGTIGVIRNISTRKRDEEIHQRITSALEGQLKNFESSIHKAQELQKKLNTMLLPGISDLNIHALLMPSETLSGDFFDIRMIDNVLFIILADCTGHGIEAAMDATLLKAISDRHLWLLHKLKAPEIFLEHMNLDLIKYKEDDKFPAMSACVIDLASKELFFSTAGAEIPLLINSGKVTRLSIRKGMVLGYKKDLAFIKHRYELKPGDILLLYSDALPEIQLNAHQLVEIEGVEKLAGKLGRGLNADSESLLREISSLHKGIMPLMDDLTMVMVQYLEPVARNFSINTEDKISLLQERLKNDCSYFSYNTNDIMQINIALGEMIINAVQHGNAGLPDKHVDVSWEISCQTAVIKITDEGTGFNLQSVPDPRDIARLKKLIDENNVKEYSSGRGIWLAKSYMDSVTYNEKGNQVIMTKKRSPLTPGFLFSYHEILKNEGNDTPITDWNEEINIGNLLKSADEKIVIIFKKNYFIKSHDIVKIIELVNSLRTSNISAEFYIENMSVKSLLSDMDIKSIANIRIH